jgi:16S rRNA (guanine527-N7)-methyltransferase
MVNSGQLFALYSQELIAWNKKFNLTTITEPQEIHLKHFLDSLTLLQAIKLTNEKVIDIGTGAGFPGIPLKITCPGIELTLLEATQKKTAFLTHIVNLLKLNNTMVVWQRAETYAKEKRGFFDLAVARAVANLSTLCELCLPFVKVGGRFIAYKEAAVADEVAKAGCAIKELGGQLAEIKKVQVFGPETINRSLVIINKIVETPCKYPRRPGMAKKNPFKALS